MARHLLSVLRENDAAYGADKAAIGFGTAALLTSPTGVGGPSFAGLAIGSKGVSAAATGLKILFQLADGDRGGAASSAIGAIVSQFPGGLGKALLKGAATRGSRVAMSAEFLGESQGVFAGQAAEGLACGVLNR